MSTDPASPAPEEVPNPDVPDAPPDAPDEDPNPREAPGPGRLAGPA